MPPLTNRQAGTIPTGKGNPTSWAPAPPNSVYGGAPLVREDQSDDVWTIYLDEPSDESVERLEMMLAASDRSAPTTEKVGDQAVDRREDVRLLAARSPLVDGNLLNSLADDADEAVARAAQANPKLKVKRIERLFAAGSAHADVILARPDIRGLEEEFVADRVVNGYQHERLAAAKNPTMFTSVLEDLSLDGNNLVRMFAIGTLRTRGDLVGY